MLNRPSLAEHGSNNLPIEAIDIPRGHHKLVVGPIDDTPKSTTTELVPAQLVEVDVLETPTDPSNEGEPCEGKGREGRGGDRY